MSLLDIIWNSQVVCVVDNQFGDTGKGKICDFLSDFSDVVVRATGGANSGHTVYYKGERRVYNLLPSGAAYIGDGKSVILGKGMAIDPVCLSREISEIEEITGEFFSRSNLYISSEASVVAPYHIRLDKKFNQSQENGGIGSTGRGIGPCYEDRVGRRGILTRDLLDEGVFRKKVQVAKEYHGDIVLEDEMMEWRGSFLGRISEFISDTDKVLAMKIADGKNVLIEGAQGLFLSLDYGFYPYVTSSDCSLEGTARGAGIRANDIDFAIGVAKFPFMTRVGAGPFPTEMGGARSMEYCMRTSCIEEELSSLGIPFEVSGSGNSREVRYDRFCPKILGLLKSSDDFDVGRGLRLFAMEFGAATGRPRRVGWADRVLLNYSARINGRNLILSKVDCASELEIIKIANSYEIEGERHFEPLINPKKMSEARPEFLEFEPYGDVSGCNSWEDLPSGFKRIVKKLEESRELRVIGVSFGAGKEDIVFR